MKMVIFVWPFQSLNIVFVILFYNIHTCCGHGRLIEPPSRASAWRYGFQTAPDYNDHELYCGGFTRQWNRNGGKCGVCGDAWDLPKPRPHENGGHWGQGVIVRKYLSASVMTIRIELTASHMGFFEFRICSEPNATEDCLDQHLLNILNGSPSQPMRSDLDTRFYPRNGNGIYEMKAQLPDIMCNQCVLQWRYVAGNNWGMCSDGNGGVGCGAQEEFRSCADIALSKEATTPMRSMKPSMLTTKRPTTFTANSPFKKSVSVWIILVAIVLLTLISVLLAWYLQKYHRQKIKISLQALSKNFFWNRNKTIVRNTLDVEKPKLSTNSVSHKPHESAKMKTATPPVPPPRTKRQSQSTRITFEQEGMY